MRIDAHKLWFEGFERFKQMLPPLWKRKLQQQGGDSYELELGMLFDLASKALAVTDDENSHGWNEDIASRPGDKDTTRCPICGDVLNDGDRLALEWVPSCQWFMLVHLKGVTPNTYDDGCETRANKVWCAHANHTLTRAATLQWRKALDE